MSLYNSTAQTVANTEYVSGNASELAYYAAYFVYRGVTLTSQCYGAASCAFGVIQVQKCCMKKFKTTAIISGIGACADAFQMFSGNATYMPISVFSKVYVYNILAGALANLV